MMSQKTYVPPKLMQIARDAIANRAIQKVNELAEFLCILTDLEPEVVVEIGVHQGGTLYAWEQVAPITIGIDWAPDGPHILGFGCSTVILGDSHDVKTVEALRKTLDYRLIDCLFIDGDHSYDGARQDFQMYSPLVRRGGLVAFHDIAPILPNQVNDENIQIKNLWDEIKDESAVEIIDSDDQRDIAGFGIGVLTR